MEYFWVILAFLCTIIGLIGSVLPALPGPPLSFAGLLLLLPCNDNDISATTIIATGIAATIITTFDFIAPAWLTKKKGGSKYGVLGATIGMFVGLFLGIWGVLFAPFAGALIGELLAKSTKEKALQMAFLSFAAFMLTTGIKVIYCIIMITIIIKEGWNIIWG